MANVERMEQAAQALLQVVKEETGIDYQSASIHWSHDQGVTDVDALTEGGLKWRHLYDHHRKDTRSVHVILKNLVLTATVHGRLGENEDI